MEGNTILDTLGTRLRDARLNKGMTQQQLRDAMSVIGKDIDVSFVALMETDRSRPGIETLAALSSVLGVSADYLLDPLQAAHNGS